MVLRFSLGASTTLADLRSLISTYPQPTNAQALAALDALVPQSDASAAIARGWSSTLAQSYLAPDGILPRMRLLAWGWTKPGDKFRSPSDAAWWKRRYQYPLWAPIETYIQQVESLGESPVFVGWDDDLARGDPGEISRTLSAVVQDDLPPVNEAPCPKWLIPPTRGMLPIPNPACLAKPIKDVIEKVRPILQPTPSGSAWWLLLLAAIFIATRERKRR